MEKGEEEKGETSGETQGIYGKLINIKSSRELKG